ncbi:hypothetical protein EON77_11790 [bacterium]|nr:MAG: hypothetical protein EON77_11790 [bacterium]
MTLVFLAMLLTVVARASGGDAAVVAQGLKSIPFLHKGLSLGLFALLVGTSLLYWGEELVLAGHVVLALLLYFAPVWVPSVFSGSNEATDAGVRSLASAGGMYGGLTVVLVLIEIVGRVRDRAKHGAKADTIKYGKGIKEEGDRKNVLMGNCWQLPYCRKFVREKCPIFHAKTTCWKELTGCMCEEQVIRGAMENRPIPKDQVAASAMIPRNRKLTDAQKRSRCKSCSIYNEHQRHKYRVSMPALLLIFAGLYFVGRQPMVAVISRMLGQANQQVNNITTTTSKVQFPSYFVEILFAGLIIVGISYAIRALEYALFKLKI